VAQAACAKLAGGTPGLGVFLWKLLCAAAHVATAWLLARAAPPASARWVLVLWLFHPWLLLESCTSAHNEALAALFLALMLERLARERFAAATLAFGAAVLTKHGCAPVGVLLLALALRRGRLGAFVTGVAGTALLTALFAWRYFSAPGALDFLAHQTGNRGASLQHFLGLALGAAVERPCLWLGYALTLLALVRAAPRVRTLADFASSGCGVLLLFIVFAMPLFSPWYHLWWAPFVAVLPATHDATRALRALAWLGPLSYMVYVTTRNLGLPHQVWTWISACALPALALPALWASRGRSRSRSPEL
jgi:hypothetical protein